MARATGPEGYSLGGIWQGLKQLLTVVEWDYDDVVSMDYVYGTPVFVWKFCDGGE